MDAHWLILKPAERKNYAISMYFPCTRLCGKIFGDGEAEGSGHGF